MESHKDSQRLTIDYVKRNALFNQRWRISWDPASQFPQFRNRVLHILDTHLGKYFISHLKAENRFAYFSGLPIPHSTSGEGINFEEMRLRSSGFTESMTFKAFEKAPDPVYLIWLLQKLFWVLEEEAEIDHQIGVLIERVASAINQSIKLSPGLEITMTRKKNKVTFYPTGAKILDEALVNDNLDWLCDYPSALKPFESALVLYQTKNQDWQRNLLDNLRLSVEQLLQLMLGNKKSFENQDNVLLVWLNQRGVHQQVINLYKALFFGPYQIYQNQAVKHSDVSSPIEVEFMIYLTGTFMRLLIQLDRSES